MLDELFARLRRDAFGGHRLERAGRGGEREETTKPYEFGDPFHLDLRDARQRAAARGERPRPARGAGRRSGCRPTTSRSSAPSSTTRPSTVLLVDMSRSMLLRGCFLAAKKVAIALDTLIRTEFPRDNLSIVGFAYYARELRPEALAELSWHGYEYGTNLQHGLLLARRILARAARRQQARSSSSPTASRPPTSRTARWSSATRRRAARSRRRCARSSAARRTGSRSTRSCSSGRGRSPTSWRYVTELNRGRAFYAEPERLGEYVLVDFVYRRT